MHVVARTLQRAAVRNGKLQPCLTCTAIQRCSSRVLSMMEEDVDDSDEEGKRQVSRIQERVAAQALPRMKQLVQNLILSSPSSSSQSSPVIPPTTASKLKQAVFYWMSRPARLIVERQEGSERRALKRALDIVFWAADHDQLLDRVADAPTLSRLLCLYISFSRVSMMEEQLEGLYQASRLWNVMVECYAQRRRQKGYSSSSNSIGIENDHDLVHAHTRLWNRRIQFLTRNKHNVHVWSKDDRATVALGGKTKGMECLEELKRLANQLDNNTATATSTGSTSMTMITTDSVYLTLLSSYANLGAAQEAHDVLTHLEWQQHPKKEVMLTNKHYNAVLMAYSNRAANAATDEDREICRQKALHLWQHSMYKMSPQLDRHDPITMSILLTMLARDDPQEAQNLMESMPNATTVHYNTVLTAWAKSKNNEQPLASQRALQVLQHMMSNQVAADRISYTAVMDALLQSNDLSALDKVDELLEQCQASAPTTHDDNVLLLCRPDPPMYIVVLRGLLGCHRRYVESQIKEDICMRMERVVEQMHKHLPPVATNVETYKLVLEGWAMSHSPMAASRAMQLLERMEQHDIAPDTAALELVLGCLSIKPNDPAWAVAQARVVLVRIKQYDLKKTPELFQRHLRVLTRSGYMEEAEELLAQQHSSKEVPQQKPDEGSIFCIIEGYARLPNGAEKADEVLQRWTRDVGGGPPSLPMLAVVMTSWAQHDHPHAIQRVEELFLQAKQISNNQLTGFFYGTYLKSLRLRPNAPVLMEQLLTTMQKDHESGLCRAKPNASNFATVLTAWSESGQEGAAERAEAILDRMETMCQYNAELKPTLDCYRGVIVAWALSNHPDCGRRAVAILDRLVQQTGLLPNRSCFRYAIKAVGKSHDLDKAAQAFELLQRMKQSFENGNQRAEPSVADYATTLRAIGSTKGSLEARSNAYELVKRVLDNWFDTRKSCSLHGQEKLYLQYLWAAFKLLHYGNRDVLVQQALRDCPLELLVKPQMRTALYKVLSRTSYQEMVERARRREWPAASIT